jgi:hypothetical protein
MNSTTDLTFVVPDENEVWSKKPINCSDSYLKFYCMIKDELDRPDFCRPRWERSIKWETEKGDYNLTVWLKDELDIPGFYHPRQEQSIKWETD